MHFLTDGPEWVILGAKQNGRYLVAASTTVRAAEITTQFLEDPLRFLDSMYSPFSRPEVEIRMELIASDFAIVYGPDYATCLARISDLMNRWERGERWQGQQAQVTIIDEAIGTGPKELPWGG